MTPLDHFFVFKFLNFSVPKGEGFSEIVEQYFRIKNQNLFISINYVLSSIFESGVIFVICLFRELCVMQNISNVNNIGLNMLSQNLAQRIRAYIFC